MKRVVSILLSVLFLLTALPLGALPVAAEYSGTAGPLSWYLDSSGHLTISGYGDMPDYGEYIMAEQQMAPWYGYDIETVTIESGVTRIGDYAFYYCDSLFSIDIADTVTSIGYEAFYSCDSLTSIVLPESLTSIGGYAFFNCDSLTTAYILGNITDMGSGMFCHCDKLTTVVLGEGLSTIGNRMFNDCTALTDIHIPAGVTSIDSQAFAGCRNLTSITVAEDNVYYTAEDSVLFNKDKTTLMQYMPSKPDTTYRIPDSVTAIGGYAFYDCDGLVSVSIPYGVTSIGSSAFCNCSSLTSVNIPDSVTTIGNYAFAYCSALTSIVIPDSVTHIEYNAFANCSSLTSVVLSAGLEYMGGSTFSNCTALESVEIPYGVSDIEYSTFEGCTALSSVTIPDSVTAIGSYAFYNCDALTSIVIPDSVASIDYCAFANSAALSSMTIPDSVTAIGGYAFEGCSSLTSMVIPDSVTSIDYGAFRNCTALSEVTIGNGVSRLPVELFYGNVSLTTLTLPSTLASIDGFALGNCSSLHTIIYNGTAADAQNIRVDISGNEALYNATWYGTDGTFTLEEREIPTLNVGDSAAVDIIYSGEKVYFQFTPHTTGYYTFYSDGGYDPYGYIMDEEGNELSYNHDIGSGWDFAVSYQMTAGTTYWLVASDYTANSFTVHLSAGDWSNIDYTIEAGGSVSLYFEDYYQTKRILFIPEHSGDYTFHVDEAYEYIDATLTDAYGNVLDSSSYYHFSFTHYLSAGESYILTTGYSGMVAYRSYTVYLREEEYYPVGCSHYYDSDCDRYCNWCEEERDVTGHEYSTAQDDSCNKCGEYRQLKYIQPDMWERVNITISYETESFLFIPTYSGEYTFSSIDNSGDPYGYLYDLYGNELSRNDDGAGNRNFTITYYLEAGVTYEFRAGCYSSGTGSYYVYLMAPALPCLNYLTYEIVNGEVTITRCDTTFAGDMVIPETIEGYPVTAIGDSAFDGCAFLESVTIPDSVTTLGCGVFWECTSLRQATLSQGITEVPPYAFADCTVLESVTIPAGVTSIGNDAFYNCDSLQWVGIPESVTSIGDRAFFGCDSLQSVSVPANVATIGNGAFANCSSLYVIGVSWSNPYYISEDGVLFNSTKTTLIQYPAGKEDAYYRVADDVTCIEALAFFGCIDLQSVTISDSITELKAYTFAYCSDLQSVTIPDSVTSIKESAFTGCTSLLSVDIPENITYIDTTVFSGCTALKTVTIPAGVDSIGWAAFGNCTSLTDVYYGGGAAQYEEMFIDEYNEYLLDATWHFIGTFYVTDGEATVGDTVTVAVGVRDNPGIVSLKLSVHYDTDALELVEVSAGDFAKGNLSFGPMEGAPFIVNWFDALSSENNVQDGVVAYLTFRVKATAPVGKTEISLSHNPNDVFDVDYTNQAFNVESSEVEIEQVIYGDLNEDGRVNIRDLGVLQQYIQRYEVTINRAAADLNRDGKINIRDLGLLQQYLNGWDVEFG